MDDSTFQYDALSRLIAETLVDRGFTEKSVVRAVTAFPPEWDSFARDFVDDYEGECEVSR